jgi:CBS domain-containing protein
VRDVMSGDVITVLPEATLAEATRLMAEEHISGLPVASSGGVVMGVISATDVLEFSAAEAGRRSPSTTEFVGEWDAPAEWDTGEAPDYFASDDDGRSLVALIDGYDGFDRGELEEHGVGEVMTRTVISVSPETALKDAARRMLDAGIHRLLVIESGRLVGVVTTTDIVRTFARSAED